MFQFSIGNTHVQEIIYSYDWLSEGIKNDIAANFVRGWCCQCLQDDGSTFTWLWVKAGGLWLTTDNEKNG